MKSVVVCVVVCCLALSLAGCATKPIEAGFKRGGVAEAKRQRDISACWTFALNSTEGRQKADEANTAHVVGSTIIGGVGGLVGSLIHQEATKNEPKKNYGNSSAFAKCMRGKGYTYDMFGN
jgi:outer membrane lipoprotein SlyB